jgi:hypothetical protein
MTEPSSPVLAPAGAAWVTAVVLSYLGVDYYALLGAFGGVLLTLGNQRAVPLLRAVGTVAITCFAGGVLGQGLASLLHLDSRPALMLFSLLFGGAGQVGVQAAIDALLARVKSLGGSQ